MNDKFTVPTNGGIKEGVVPLIFPCSGCRVVIGEISKFALIGSVAEAAAFSRRYRSLETRSKAGYLGCLGHGFVKRVQDINKGLFILSGTSCRSGLGCRLLCDRRLKLKRGIGLSI